MDYVSHVLPALGEESSTSAQSWSWSRAREVTLSDTPDVERLKAELRMAEVVPPCGLAPLLRRAARAGRAHGGPLRRRARAGVRELLERARGEGGLSAAARERFRMDVLRRFYADYSEKLGGLAVQAFDEVEKSLRKDRLLNRFMDAVWPRRSPRRSCARSSRRAGARGGGGRRPRRGRAADPAACAQRLERVGRPLIDEARELLLGARRGAGT